MAVYDVRPPEGQVGCKTAKPKAQAVRKLLRKAKFRRRRNFVLRVCWRRTAEGGMSLTNLLEFPLETHKLLNRFNDLSCCFFCISFGNFSLPVECVYKEIRDGFVHIR